MARILQIAGSSSPSRFVCKTSQRDGVFFGPIHSAQIYTGYANRYEKMIQNDFRIDVEVINMPLEEVIARIRGSERQYEIPDTAQRKLTHFKE